MIKSLDKKWKELVFSMSGFGPNFLMVLMGAFFTDAINPSALPAGSLQAIGSSCLILPALFPVLWMIAKIFDGVVDIPMASITDNLKTKWGRRRPTIAVCFVPMVVSYALCWLPVGGTNQVTNTVWIILWAFVFFATYTMSLISFYGSLSTVCSDEKQRLRVSSFKAFFDTISYCVVYALVPVLLQATKLHIDKFVFCCLPLMITMLIPLFLIKEGEKYGYPELQGASQEKVGIVESLKLTFGNKLFMRWIVVNCCAYFGLQMFLVGMNALILGGMGFSGAEMTIINTCAFAPVPIMLWLFNKLKAKKGIRFTFQTCLLAFAVAILSFDFASLYVTGGNKTVQMIIACVGGVLGSWAIGSFFMMPYMVPAQISSVEEKLTGKNHSAMYFAAQAVTTSIAGAISSSLVYENIKMLFISKGASGVKYALNFEEAATKFGVSVDNVFNLGTLLVPLVVCVMCVIGFVLAFRMPKDYSPVEVAKELKKQSPDLDISGVTDEGADGDARKEIVFVQVALSILSGFIFCFIWIPNLLKTVKSLGVRLSVTLHALISVFIPFASVFTMLTVQKQLAKIAEEKNVKLTGKTWLYVVLGIFFPILPLNVIALSILQHDVNKLLG